MGKSKSGYKRPYRFQAPEGVEVECSDATYKRLRGVARESRCTIGYWVETTLLNYLQIGFNAPTPNARPSPTGNGKTHTFQLSDQTYGAIERFAGLDKAANRWIAISVLFALGIEEERLRGVREQPDRFD